MRRGERARARDERAHLPGAARGSPTGASIRARTIARSLGRSRATLSEALSARRSWGSRSLRVRGQGLPARRADRVPRRRGASRARWARALRACALEVVDEIESTSTRLLERGGGGRAFGHVPRRGVAERGARAARALVGLARSAARSRSRCCGASSAARATWAACRSRSGVAVARALAACGVERVQVKWPNDVVVRFPQARRASWSRPAARCRGRASP